MNISISGSSGNFLVNHSGEIIDKCLNDDEYENIEKFDIKEYFVYYGKIDTYIDILDVGYWLKDGSYVSPDNDFRSNFYNKE